MKNIVNSGDKPATVARQSAIDTTTPAIVDTGMGLVGRFLGSLRRRTSSGLYMPELDGLRFVAIASVFFYHLTGDIQRHSPPGGAFHSGFLFLLTQKLDVGVPLFFVISGMILSLPFASHFLSGKKPVRLSNYFLRRLTRLEPPYIATLILFFTLKILNDRGNPGDLLPHLLSSMFYLHNLIYQLPSSINIVAWSLEIEVQFYILVPLLIRVFAVRSAFVRRSILCLAIVFFCVLNVLTDRLHLNLLGHAHYFLVGFLLTDLYLTGALIPSTGRFWDIVSSVGWPLTGFGLVYGRGAFLVALPFVVLVLYAAAFKGPASKRVFGGLLLASIGGMCYSIYLVHNFAIAATGFLTEQVLAHANLAARLLVQTVLISGPVLLASLILYKLVEQPCMDPRWPSRLISKIQHVRGNVLGN